MKKLMLLPLLAVLLLTACGTEPSGNQGAPEGSMDFGVGLFALTESGVRVHLLILEKR